MVLLTTTRSFNFIKPLLMNEFNFGRPKHFTMVSCNRNIVIVLQILVCSVQTLVTLWTARVLMMTLRQCSSEIEGQRRRIPFQRQLSLTNEGLEEKLKGHVFTSGLKYMFDFLGYSKAKDGLYCLPYIVFPMPAHRGKKSQCAHFLTLQKLETCNSDDLKNHAVWNITEIL